MSRRSQRGRATTYSDGDVVEILRSKGVATGTLLKKIPDSNPESPRWLIALSEGNATEEIGEKMLGKVVGEGAGGGETKKKARGGRGRGNVRGTAAKTKATTRSARSVSTGSSSDQQDAQSTSNESKLSLPKTRAQPASKATTAVRKRRSPPALAGADGSADPKKKAKTEMKQEGQGQRSTRAAAKTNPNIELSELPMKQVRKPAKKVVGNNNKPLAKSPKEHVTKIKMKTGVLYLFRGEKRRAEFVWSR